MDIFDLLVWIIRAIKKAGDTNATQQAALRAQIEQSMAQLNTRAASTVVVAPKAAPILPPINPPTPAVPSPSAATAGLGVVPIAQPLPSAEGLLVSGLFTKPRSLVAAFVASEILGPPVAFRRH
jgi:hypothetical protein